MQVIQMSSCEPLCPLRRPLCPWHLLDGSVAHLGRKGTWQSIIKSWEQNSQWQWTFPSFSYPKKTHHFSFYTVLIPVARTYAPTVSWTGHQLSCLSTGFFRFVGVSGIKKSRVPSVWEVKSVKPAPNYQPCANLNTKTKAKHPSQTWVQ